MQSICNKKAQSVFEYAIMLAIVSAACITMVLYVRRATEGNMADISNAVTIKSLDSRY